MPYPIKHSVPKAKGQDHVPKSQGVLCRNTTDKNVIETILANDVLPGRGKHVYGHNGNRIFLSLVKDCGMKHSSCPNYLKKDQAKMIYESMNDLNPPGRFLKLIEQEEGRELWQEMNEDDAIFKIRQAMRDNSRRNMASTIRSNQHASACASLQAVMNDRKLRRSPIENLYLQHAIQDAKLQLVRNALTFVPRAPAGSLRNSQQNFLVPRNMQHPNMLSYTPVNVAKRRESKTVNATTFLTPEDVESTSAQSQLQFSNSSSNMREGMNKTHKYQEF